MFSVKHRFLVVLLVVFFFTLFLPREGYYQSSKTIPQGEGEAPLPSAGNRIQVGSLPMFVEGDVSSAGDGTVAVNMLEISLARQISPLSVAFSLDISRVTVAKANAAHANAANANAANTNVAAGDADALAEDIIAQEAYAFLLDYSRIPMPFGGSLESRLALYFVGGCFFRELPANPELEQPGSRTVLECKERRLVPSHNERERQQLIADLADMLAGAEDQEAGDSYLILGTTSAGDEGDYSATPLATVAEHQVSLATGAAIASYPIPVPPPRADAAPEVTLVYNSGGVDGLHTSRNNQPGSVGIGWSLQSGAIVHHLKPCLVPQAPEDLCPTYEYSIELNGVTSRLVQDKNDANRYHLRDDPYWRVEKKTAGGSHPDSDNAYWLVTTPDGMQYRFGGEYVAESGADQNSVFFVPTYGSQCSPYDSYWICDIAWQWNLDRTEDPNGNVINYFYEQEINYYDARTFSWRDYVRAGHVQRIEYSTTAGESEQPHARVLFNMEQRCSDPASVADCEWQNISEVVDYPDTPGDLVCLAQYGANCEHHPTFWSHRRLDSVQTQVYEPASSQWRTVALYDLSQSFPDAEESEDKLWLESIVQRPGGDFAVTAFSQIEAERFDGKSANVSVVQKRDISLTNGVDMAALATTDAHIYFNRVDFDSGATGVLARVANGSYNDTLEFRLDSETGTLIGTVNVPITGGLDSWQTVSATISGVSGVHDLYVVGTTSTLALNWFRFVPNSALPGLPAVSYEYEMLNNRVNHPSGVSPMNMPRIDRIENELGGIVEFTYGHSHPCQSSYGSYIRIPDDCFVAWDAGDPDYSGDDGWVLWHKWKVLAQTMRDDFSGNPNETLSFAYSQPMWHYSDNPALPEANGCGSGGYTYPCGTNHWNDFRGSELVTVTDASGAKTEHRFYPGLDGDRLGISGGAYSHSITLSDSTTRTDSNWLRGRTAEVRRLDGQDSALTRTLNWFYAANTINGGGTAIKDAYFVALEKSEETLYGTNDKTTRVEYAYDAYGNVTREILHGDVADAGDDRNWETRYLYNTADYIVDRPLWRALWAGTTSGGDLGGGGGGSCSSYVSTDVPKYISPYGPQTVTSDVTVGDSGTIADVNVLDLHGTHSWIGDLEFRLTSAEETEVQIMAPACTWQDNFDLNLDDEAAPGAWPCPPTGGGTYQPSNPLSAFDGEEENGVWTLTVQDHYNNDGGYLNGWSVEICTVGSTEPAPTGNELALTMYAYDGAGLGATPAAGNMSLERAYWQTTPSAGYSEAAISYDSAGRPTQLTDANGATTTTAYEPFYGYAMTTTNALTHTTSVMVDPGWGVVVQRSDANDRLTTISYDTYGRLTDVWLPTEPITGPASLEYDYHLEARPAYVQERSLRDASSSAYLDLWTYVDGFGRQLQSQRPSETTNMRVVSSRQLNDLGRLVYQSAPYEISGAAGSGYAQPTWTNVDSYQRFTYDDLGRSTLQETMSGANVLWSSSNSYDGWTTRYTDANGHDTVHTTDGFGQLVAVIEYNDEGSGPVSYTTGYQYDLRGNLNQVTGHLNNISTMSYDLLGRKTTMVDPDMGSWSYQYDAVGNLTAQQDGRGLWLYMSYDELNRLVSKRRDSAAGSLVAEYQYDASEKGYLDSSNAYDALGLTVEVEVQYLERDDGYRVTAQQWVVSGQGSFKMGYGYDGLGNLASVQYPANNLGEAGETVDFSYNSVGQLAQIVSQQDNTHFLDDATYEPSGQVASLRLDQGTDGATISYSYEPGSMRLSQKQAGSGGGAIINLQELSYSYDNVGNITSLTDAVNAGQALSFGYDWLDRLTSAGTTAVGTGQYSHSYTYDAIGNITDYNGAGYTYGGGQPHAVTAAFGNSYGYDANGNQTSRTIGGTTYTQVFDYQNRLVEVKEDTTSIGSFIYDADGNRVVGTVDGTTTVYIGGLFEYQAGAMTSYYAGPAGVLALRRTGFSSDNGIFYLLPDHLGSTSVIVNENGTISAQQYYYPYGGNRGAAFSAMTTKRFTGQYHEEGLPGGEGLSYYNARWYDPQLGRFVSADSIVPDSANPQNYNRFAYVVNNPLSFTDPSGHAECADANCHFVLHPKSDRVITRKPAPPGITAPAWTPSRSAPASSRGQPANWPPFLIERQFVTTSANGLQWFGNTAFAAGRGYTNYCGLSHCGLDFLADSGEPVYAGVTGIVTRISCPEEDCDVQDERFGPYSVHVKVGAYTVIYGHLDTGVQIGVGDEVSPDTVIAGVGNDKYGVTHLHVEITDWQYTYNPLPFFRPDLRAALVNLAFEFGAREINLAGVTFSSRDSTFMNQPWRICRRGGQDALTTCP